MLKNTTARDEILRKNEISFSRVGAIKLCKLEWDKGRKGVKHTTQLEKSTVRHKPERTKMPWPSLPPMLKDTDAENDGSADGLPWSLSSWPFAIHHSRIFAKLLVLTLTRWDVRFERHLYRLQLTYLLMGALVYSGQFCVIYLLARQV